MHKLVIIVHCLFRYYIMIRITSASFAGLIHGLINIELRFCWPIYTTKIDGVVCPPNISETVAGRLMKLAHRQRIASTTIRLISKKITVHFMNFSKNNSANRRWPEAQTIAAIWFGRLSSQSRSPCPGFEQNVVAIYCALRLPSLGDRGRSL